MHEVISWLAGVGIGLYYWVGAWDMDRANDVKWVEHPGWIIQPLFTAGEPDHNIGDCVVLDIFNMGLRMGICDEQRPSICQYEQ